ncbi:MAG: alpha/beta fold hydrolase [Chloroflexota bacterium]
MLMLRALAAGLVAPAWGAFAARRALYGLHALQLDGYYTPRFMAWITARRERVARTEWLGLVVAASALAAAGVPGRPSRARAASLALASLLGALAWLRARPEPAKKPLVLTARARRLLATATLLQIAAAAAPALAVGHKRRSWQLALTLIPATSLAAPFAVALANLLNWPIEEALRRYYLYDARRRIRQLGPTVVAVAGSYGKTSTKEFIGSLLSTRHTVLRPPGSHNTPMGLSRVIREQLEPRHQVFVCELGDYQPGDISQLCRVVSPSIGVLTAIGPEHLERFKTMERVIRSKRELVDALPDDGVLIVNQDDPAIRDLAEHGEMRGLKVVRVSQHAETAQTAHLSASDVRMTRQGLGFTVTAADGRRATISAPVLGRHNVTNILQAIAVSLELGLSLEAAADAAARIEPVEHRLQPIEGQGGVLVIDDAFNSNPAGAAEALNVLGEIDARRRVLVTPGMIELAELEYQENKRLGQRAAAVCDDVILVGPARAVPIREGLLAERFPSDRIHVVRNLGEATGKLGSLVGAGDAVLFENDLPDTYDDGRLDDGGLDDGTLASTNGHAPNPAPQPAPAEDPRLLIDGIRINHRVAGKAGAPWVVILHGWGASIQAVSSIEQCLAATHCTLAIDLPGFGASELPPDSYGSPEYAAVVIAVLERLDISQASFIGHSYGGKVAIQIAARRPDLVERLVLVDSAGIRPVHGLGYWARVWLYKSFRLALTAPARLIGHEARARAALAGLFGSTDFKNAGPLRAVLVRSVAEDVRELLPRITAPTLLIWGELDHDTPLADGRLMESLIPDAGLVVFPSAGHFAYADDLPRFARVVGHFLAPS